MTKVTLYYELLRPLGDEDFDNVSKLHGTYGVARVQVAPSMDRLVVDYDASRLRKSDVEAELARFNLPVRLNSAA